MKRRKQNRKAKSATPAALIDTGRHSQNCIVCQHPARFAIEQQFVDWKPVAIVSREWKISRGSLYRHAHGTGLLEKRDMNVRRVLSTFIERCHRVKPNATSMLGAIQALAKINSEGQWIDRSEVEDVTASRNLALFGRMNAGELLRYAESGELPPWFASGTPARAPSDAND